MKFSMRAICFLILLFNYISMTNSVTRAATAAEIDVGVVGHWQVSTIP
jgi:hypothetical protein